MGVGFAGNNTTVKIAGGGSRSTAGTAFSTGSNQYAIATVYITGTSNSMTVGAHTATLPSSYSSTVYVGPSSSLTISGGGSGVVNFASWVIFENSP